MNMITTFQFDDAGGSQSATIKVIGLGGGGNNATEYMFQQFQKHENGTASVDFVGLNTDAQALRTTTIPITMQLGEEITKGLGAGANPEIGRQAAYADRERLQAILEGTDMVFVTAGMGGGTGTGAAPVVAEIAKEMGILTVAIVTKPFLFEGRKRMMIAEQGIQALSRIVDSLIIIPNNRLLSVLGKQVSLIEAFNAANDVLYGAVKGISELITQPGLINVDFADVRTVMAEMGMAMMGMGTATGENRARLAAESAIASPLLENANLFGARGVLVNITGGRDLSIGEFEDVGEVIRAITSEDATVVVGTVIDSKSEGISVTIVATGLSEENPAVSGESAANENLETYSVSSGHNDYQKYERPAVLRRQNTHLNNKMNMKEPLSSNSNLTRKSSPQSTSANSSVGQDINMLDIPSFLRKRDENLNNKDH